MFGIARQLCRVCLCHPWLLLEAWGELDHLEVKHGSLLSHQLPVRSSGFQQINHVEMCFGLWCCVVKSAER